jgi:hypothetical protein
VRGEHRLYDDALASSFGSYAERITINTAQLGATFGDTLCANMCWTTLLQKLVYNIGAEEIRQ